MTILKITANDLDENGFYLYSERVANHPDNIELDPGLGIVRIKRSMRCGKTIQSGEGTGLWVQGNIYAEDTISVQGVLIVNLGLRCNRSVDALDGIKVDGNIYTGFGLRTPMSIQCKGIMQIGGTLKAGKDISCDRDITTTDLVCESNVYAGFNIHGSGNFSITGTIYAGVNMQDANDAKITCRALLAGTIGSGTLVLVP